VYKEFIDEVIKACKEVTLLLDNLSSSDFDYVKLGAGGDMSSVIDLQTEAVFISHLKKFGQIISEESGEVGEGDAKIIIDPLDGSDNLASGFPYYGTSIALVENSQTTVGIICNFANGDIFVKTKEKFEKAHLETLEFKRVQNCTNAKIGLFEKARVNHELINKLTQNMLKFRSPGAVALSLAYAHSVRFVIFGAKARSFDVQAGLFMCEELYVYYDENLLFVSHDKEVFDQLSTILLKDR